MESQSKVKVLNMIIDVHKAEKILEDLFNDGWVLVSADLKDIPKGEGSQVRFVAFLYK